MTNTRKSTPAPARRRKAAARPDGMRSYRAASALASGGLRFTDGVSRKTDELIAVARESGLRFQHEWIISFVAIVAMLALLAGLYLNVTASASIAGRQIQNLEADITMNEQVNADLETRIATLMANSVLEKRALALGFEPVERQTLQYVLVPGYFPPQAVTMISTAAPVETLANSPEFNETLIDWISKQIQTASLPLSESRR